MTDTTPLAPDLAPVDDANAFSPGVWPDAIDRPGEEATLRGMPLTSLAAEFGTPLLVIDEDQVRDRAHTTRQTFESAFGDVAVYYAGKALLTTDVARWMHAEGLRVDVCSLGEFTVAQAAGVPAERMGFHGNNKSDVELATTIEAGIGSIVCDSPEEIERVAEFAAEAGAVQAVRLRVSIGVHASTHEYLATSHEDQKFGVAAADAPALVARIRELPSLKLLGLHTHIGSQIVASDGFVEAARRMLALHASLLADGDVPELNLGGGFGIRYTAGEPDIDLEAFAAELAAAVREECERLQIEQPKLCFEPGRSIVGTAGITLYEVGTVKPVAVPEGERVYVSVDGGMSDNARPALYEAQYSARIVSRASDADPVVTRVVGMHCESGDIVVDAEWLPGDVGRGDLLAVAATGAYCHSLSSNYNMTPRPGIVAVSEAGAQLIVRPETISDLLARDVGADAASTASKENS